jgi:phosphatidate cytidylyltransferase
MLRERIAIAFVLLPLVLWVVVEGGWFYVVGVAAVLSLAAVEFALLFRVHGRRPALPLIVSAVVALTVLRYVSDFQFAALSITVLTILTMIWHLVDFELGAQGSGTDFAISIAGITYLGWIGSYLISLRDLPHGSWWILLVLPIVWFADSGAYFIGKAIGRRKLSPRLSPKKTWEGYLGGIIVAGVAGIGLGSLWRFGAGGALPLTVMNSLILSVILSVSAPIGDLGVSMIKREIKVKDTGSLLPGHGGALDRIDSWIWGAVIGFYVISWLFY